MAERGDKQIRVVNGPFSKDKRRLFDIIRSGRFQRNFLSVPLTKALPMQNLTLWFAQRASMDCIGIW